MSVIDCIVLFGIMVALAALPSSSVALVVARSATLGVSNGIAAAIGIVMGDLLFIALAIFGLSVVAETMGSFFVVIKVLGGIYLIWLGVNLLKSAAGPVPAQPDVQKTRSLAASFAAGLVLTLGDVKAIFFYVSLFPMFVELTALTSADLAAIVAITIIGVGSVKVAYAILAGKLADFAQRRQFGSASRKVAGGLMVGAGSYLILKA